MPRTLETAKVIKSVYLPIPLCNRVEEEAWKRGVSFSAFVEVALRFYLAFLESEERKRAKEAVKNVEGVASGG